MDRLLTIFSLSILAAVAFGDAPRTPSPPGAAVYFISPADGAVVTSPVTVRFGLRGMGVAPAGIDSPNTGHHHLLIDADVPDMSLPLPANEHVLHFGKGQTEADVPLPASKHTLQLVLGNQLHVPHDPPVLSQKITITVK